MYGYIASMYFYIPHVCLVPTEARRRCQIPWAWNYHHVGGGNQTQDFRRAASALNLGVISQAPDSHYFLLN